jgi:hypothetical protein
MVDYSDDDIIDIFPLYEPENRFLEAFFQFAYRLNSLYRQWNVTKTQISRYLDELCSSRGREIIVDETLLSDEDKFLAAGGFTQYEVDMELNEVIASDEEYFPEFLRGAVLSQGLTLLETMLDDVAKEVASALGETVKLDDRRMPYINRYILYLTKCCGLDLEIPAHLWKRLDAIRELRNSYIHKLDRDLPSEIRATLESLVVGIPNSDTAIDNEFVEHGLDVVVEVGKKVELAFWQWFEARIETSRG